MPLPRRSKCIIAGFTCLVAVSVCAQNGLDIQAHRGGRGLWPENSLEAFRNALTLGVDTLELDLACTADGIPVVSHDPFLSWILVRHRNAAFLDKSERIAIKDINYSNLENFSIGEINKRSDYRYRFSSQTPIPGQKIPSLAELFDLAESLNPAIRYNIEIKTYPPFPDRTLDYRYFADRVLEVIEKAGVKDRVVIQSFDWRVLAYIRRTVPKIRLSCLCVENFPLDGESYNLQLQRKGASEWLAGLDADDYSGTPALVAAFGGDIYSPYYKDMQSADIEEAHRLGLKVLPWTVNNRQTMQELIELGVDGIITDRPDILLELRLSEKSP